MRRKLGSDRANRLPLWLLLALIVSGFIFAESRASSPLPVAHAAESSPQAIPPVPRGETPQEAQRQSAGCVSCHTATDSASMHPGSTVVIGCVDCHGGDPSVMAAGARKSAEYMAATRKAHVAPRFAEDAARGGHPVRAYTRWLRESLEWVRFVNPGDLRVAPADLRFFWLPHRGSSQRLDQHDDSRCDALGRGAL